MFVPGDKACDQHVIIIGFHSCLEPPLQTIGLRTLHFLEPEINVLPSRRLHAFAHLRLKKGFLKAPFTVTTPDLKI